MKKLAATITILLSLSTSAPAQPASPPNFLATSAAIQRYSPPSRAPANSSADFTKGWNLAVGLYRMSIFQTQGNPQGKDMLVTFTQQHLNESQRMYDFLTLPHGRRDDAQIQRVKGEIAYYTSALQHLKAAPAPAAPAQAPPAANQPQPKDESWAETDSNRVTHDDYVKRKANHEDSISSGNRTVTRSDMERRDRIERDYWEQYRRGDITVQQYQDMMNALP